MGETIIKILNLYGGIGGNRKLWGGNIHVTMVELDPKIASIYKENFPQDDVIIGDAHEYLLNNFENFDFIWSSPPCPTHSKVRFANLEQNKPVYPDMKLYEEIILLQHHFKGKFVVENVISYYDPLIKPQICGKHYFWTNFKITELPMIERVGRGMGEDENLKDLYELKGFDLTNYGGINKLKTIRNCVEPRVGKHIFDLAFKSIQSKLIG